MWEHLAHYRVILGSQSPRRVELLRGLDLDFEQCTLPDVDESYPDGLALREIPSYIARKKAEAYYATLSEDTLLITADTLVFVEDEVLGKPRTTDEAASMLQRLSFPLHRGRSSTMYSIIHHLTRLEPTASRSGSATRPSRISRVRSIP